MSMDTEEELKKLGVNPVGGQHFIDSERSLEAFISSCDTSGKTVLEIGAGTGNITERIDAEKVYTVEKDTVLAEFLEEKFEDEDVEVLNEDFLSMDIPDDVDFILGNIPFEISSDIIKKLGEAQIPASLIVQEAYADKIVSGPGESDYGKQSFRTQLNFLPVKEAIIPASSYIPEPEVDTAVVKLFPNRDRHGIEDVDGFVDFASALFTHPNKKLRNSFVDARHILEVSKEEAKELRDEFTFSEKRVNNMEISELGETFQEFNSLKS